MIFISISMFICSICCDHRIIKEALLTHKCTNIVNLCSKQWPVPVLLSVLRVFFFTLPLPLRCKSALRKDEKLIYDLLQNTFYSCATFKIASPRSIHEAAGKSSFIQPGTNRKLRLTDCTQLQNRSWCIVK